MRNLMSKQQVLDLFIYDYDCGGLLWRIGRTNVVAGSKAGSLKSKGYLSVQVDKKLYKLASLVWIMFNDTFDESLVVDHIDGDPSNNKISNLRLASSSENQLNSAKRKGTSSKYKGVHWNKQSNSWRASIRINGKAKYIGNYSNEYAAHLAWCEVAKELHGEFFRSK